MQKVHFIAIGGSAMHNLALALHKKGFQVTGSDDEIFEPSLTRLAAKNLLPEQFGWFPDKNIHSQLDAIILGMHARADNPELLKANELGIKIYSYPEYIYEQSKNKQRIVIAGSHGKTSITSMILHVLKHQNKSFDYLVGAQLEGFDNMVQLSDAPIIVIEGDEYLDSPTNRTPKFLFYNHHTAVISGIAWDHINVFPTFEEYKLQFQRFLDLTPKSGVLIYNEDDKNVNLLLKNIKREDIQKIAYQEHKSKIKDGETYLLHDLEKIKVPFFGVHNMYNVNAAKQVCLKLGVSESEFYIAIQSFKGASNRLELLAKKENTFIFKDFAHAPSKLEATTKAVKKQFPKHKIIACLELHTFSSLNKDFLGQYAHKFDAPDLSIVYFNPQTVKHKKLPDITKKDISKGFAKDTLMVFDNSQLMRDFVESIPLKNVVLLLMSSGNFDGIHLNDFAQQLINKPF